MSVIICSACLSSSCVLQIKSPSDYEYFYKRATSSNILKCMNCGSFFQFPEPTPDEISNFYHPAYQNYINTDVPALRFITKVYSRIIASSFATTYGKSALILDFGCGQGEFLRCLYRYGCSNLYGFDFDIYPEAKKDRIKLINDFEELFSLNVRFNVIRMNHVIEHLSDLDFIMPRLLELLSDDGCIIGQTPNANHYTSQFWGRFWGNYHYPYHLTIFSVEGLNMACSRWKASLTTNSALLTNGWALSCENLIKSWLKLNTKGRTFFYPVLMFFSLFPAMVDHIFSPQASANFNFKITPYKSIE